MRRGTTIWCVALAEREKSGRIDIRPGTLAEGNRLVAKWHRHHKPLKVHRFCIVAERKGVVLGAAIVCNPVAPGLQDGRTWEVRRLVTPGLRTDRRCWGVASALLRAAWSASKALGVRRLVSYTRVDEPGYCYAAAGWVRSAEVRGRGWNSGNKGQRWLPNVYEPTTEIVDRMRWEAPIKAV